MPCVYCQLSSFQIWYHAGLCMLPCTSVQPWLPNHFCQNSLSPPTTLYICKQHIPVLLLVFSLVKITFCLLILVCLFVCLSFFLSLTIPAWLSLFIYLLTPSLSYVKMPISLSFYLIILSVCLLFFSLSR